LKLWWLRPCHEPWGEQALDFVPDEQASQPPDIALAYTKAARKDEAGIPNLGEGFGKDAEKDKEFKEGIGLWRPVGGSVNLGISML